MTTVDLSRGASPDELRRWERRAVRFPDGITRLVGMKRNAWLALDWLVQERGWNPQQIAGAAFGLAQRWHAYNGLTFEVELQDSFALIVASCRDIEAESMLGRTNDNRAA